MSACSCGGRDHSEDQIDRPRGRPEAAAGLPVVDPAGTRVRVGRGI